MGLEICLNKFSPAKAGYLCLYRSQRDFLFANREWVQPPPVKVSWDAEIEMELKRKKETKRRPPASAGSVELPAPVVSAAALTSAARPAASAVQKASPREAQSLAAPPAPAKTSAAHDLLGLGAFVFRLANNRLHLHSIR